MVWHMLLKINFGTFKYQWTGRKIETSMAFIYATYNRTEPYKKQNLRELGNNKNRQEALSSGLNQKKPFEYFIHNYAQVYCNWNYSFATTCFTKIFQVPFFSFKSYIFDYRMEYKSIVFRIIQKTM